MLEGNWPYTSLMEQVDQVESVLPHLAGPDELIWRWQTYSIFNVSNGCCFDTGAIGKSMSYPGRGRNPAEFFCLSICNQKGARFLSFATPKCTRTDWNVMFVVLNLCLLLPWFPVSINSTRKGPNLGNPKGACQTTDRFLKLISLCHLNLWPTCFWSQHFSEVVKGCPWTAMAIPTSP